MSKISSKNKKTKWRDIILEWESSSQSMRSFSRDRKISDSTLSYWRRKIFPKKYAPSSKKLFKELVDISSQESIEIEYRNIKIQIQKGFDQESLLHLLSTLRRL